MNLIERHSKILIIYLNILSVKLHLREITKYLQYVFFNYYNAFELPEHFVIPQI